MQHVSNLLGPFTAQEWCKSVNRATRVHPLGNFGEWRVIESGAGTSVDDWMEELTVEDDNNRGNASVYYANLFDHLIDFN